MLVSFENLPATARLWTFAAARPLADAESAQLGPAVERFLNEWTAHKVPLATAWEWRLNRFLFVAVDESMAGASGCSIDALVRFMRQLEQQLGVTFTDNGPVLYRGAAGDVQRVTRPEFMALAEKGAVTPDTTVFDTTLTTVGALREGRWEVPARQSWHARAFF